MVNHILNDYVQGLRRRMLHVPLRVQRRLVSELVAHIEADIVQLRREHAWDMDQATEKAIEAFCPLDDVLPLFGPEEGIIRRSTAQWVVHAPKVESTRRAVDGRKWGYAAAGIAVVGLLALAVVMTPPASVDLHPEGTPGDVLGAWRFGNMTGLVDSEIMVPSVGAMIIASDGDGCLEVQLTAPSGIQHQYDGCLTDDWNIPSPEQGEWLVRMTGAAYTGTISVTAA